MTQRVNCIIMGGGRGTRLYPLTKDRCKPAVPLAGKYRLVDIPISNCLNSGFNKIYLLTQYNTASLHRHVQSSYKFDPFGGGFVDILAAEQTMEGESWYQGTADCVRQNMHHFENTRDSDLFLILSGDQLYRMDFQTIVRQHLDTKADITIAAKPMPTAEVHGLGVMRVKGDGEITEFVEKPKDPKVVESLVIGDSLRAQMKNPGDGKYCLASMGIYVFTAKVMREALNSTATDFGKEIIPGLLGKKKLMSFLFDDYWEDIGTVGAFFQANLSLADIVPPFNFFDYERPIFTHARYMPATKLNGCKARHSILSDGCIITNAEINHCVIGLRSVVNDGTVLENVVMMGADSFELPGSPGAEGKEHLPPVGVGKNCRISNAIIDKNARIGNNVRLSPEGKPDLWEQGALFVRDGVLVVTKNGVVPDNTVI